MNLPNLNKLKEKLKSWREDVVKKKRNEVAVAANVNVAQVGKWESGPAGFSYDRLVDIILPAYGVTDIDIFLDYCQDVTLDNVVFVKNSDRSNAKTDTMEGRFTHPTTLKKHRTRLDLLNLNPGAQTSLSSHEGHEYVMVLDGEVVFDLAETNDGEKRSYTLKKHDSIVFQSKLFHQVRNMSSDKPATLAVARPVSSLPEVVRSTLGGR